MRLIHRCQPKLICALMGMDVVQEVVHVANVPPKRWYENAHLRKTKRGETDIVVRAKRGLSGRFDHCVPIGEWRDGAYRVRRDILDAWGVLSGQDGFIHRRPVPPALKTPWQFLECKWKQAVAP